MDPHWTNGTATLYRADARTIPLPDNSVHCVVTSPPYFGLRNYGLTNWTGGDPDCLHSPGPEKAANEQPKQPVQCKQCRARKEDLGIGNESTLQEYVDSVVQVFREIWRVLRDDGTCWVNLGDSYANDGKWGGATGGRHAQGLHGRTGVGRTKTRTGLKPKNLMMAPARIAIALQDDGWVVRQRVIWHKTRNTPEAVEDRPVSTNEDIYFLAKSCDPLFWTHRELPGTRTEPEPDYRWTDMITGVEYNREPADYSSSETGELVECPDCLGQGEMDARETQIALFDDIIPETIPCHRCNHQDAETPGFIRRWRRTNLWKGHDYFYDFFAVRQPTTSGPSDVRKMQESRNRMPGNSKTMTEPHPEQQETPQHQAKTGRGGPNRRQPPERLEHLSPTLQGQRTLLRSLRRYQEGQSWRGPASTESATGAERPGPGRPPRPSYPRRTFPWRGESREPRARNRWRRTTTGTESPGAPTRS